ncbi:MAG: hypothetical protein WCC95_22485 [Candidatus Sulfotelmatobacter sp.]
MTRRSTPAAAEHRKANSHARSSRRLATIHHPLITALAAVLFSAIAFLNLHALPAVNHTFTGEVSDAMCGRKHMEGTPARECTRACVAHGSKFALVVGDKIYTLDTSDKAALATLDKQAGKTATVKGSLNDAGDTIEVSSVMGK